MNHNADTAEPVTPLIRTEGYIRLAALVGNRLITLSDPNELQAWELPQTNLPIDIIADYARLLSGHRLNASGVSIPLKPRELADASVDPLLNIQMGRHGRFAE